MIALILFTLSPIKNVNANSAQTHWNGVTATGAMITDEDCPIIVQNENLTFNIDTFPVINYISEEAARSYNASVTAEYTFYNPADYTVNATLAFPFGIFPYYGYYHTPENSYERIEEDFSVTVNDESVENTIRHTFSYEHLDYNNERDLPKLVEGYVKDDFYRTDLPVYTYEYTLNSENKNEDGYFYAVYRWKKQDDVKLYYLGNCYRIIRTDEYLDIIFRFERESSVTLCFLGGQPKESPTWKFHMFSTSGSKLMEEVSGTYKNKNITETDFYSFVMTAYDRNLGVTESDWYNAIVYDLKNEHDFNLGMLSPKRKDFFVYSSLMRWCYYNITLKPKESIVNAVTVPLYPDINTNYSTTLYTYKYLLSPAQTWKDFQSLNIEIVTRYVLIQSKGFDFVQNEAQSKYTLSLQGLPSGELSFILAKEHFVIPTPTKGCSLSLNHGNLVVTALLIASAYFIISKKRG